MDNARLVALINEHFGKITPEDVMRAVRFAHAVSAMEREGTARVAEASIWLALTGRPRPPDPPHFPPPPKSSTWWGPG